MMVLLVALAGLAVILGARHWAEHLLKTVIGFALVIPFVLFGFSALFAQALLHPWIAGGALLVGGIVLAKKLSGGSHGGHGRLEQKAMPRLSVKRRAEHD